MFRHVGDTGEYLRSHSYSVAPWLLCLLGGYALALTRTRHLVVRAPRAARVAAPSKIAAASKNARRPVNTRVMFYSLLDMAGISVNDPASEALSVFSENLSIGPRMVLRSCGLVDFDRWMTSQAYSLGPAQRGAPASL